VEARKYLYGRWVEDLELGESRREQELVRIAKRYMVEFLTFGVNIRRRRGVVLSLDDAIMAELYGVPCFRLPKPGRSI
jgi:hypothetical protein